MILNTGRFILTQTRVPSTRRKFVHAGHVPPKLEDGTGQVVTNGRDAQYPYPFMSHRIYLTIPLHSGEPHFVNEEIHHPKKYCTSRKLHLPYQTKNRAGSQKMIMVLAWNIQYFMFFSCWSRDRVSKKVVDERDLCTERS